MDRFGKFLAALLMAGIAVFLGTIGGAVFGALSGWVVGWTPFGRWAMHVMEVAGIRGVTMAEVGALVGWLGMFLKTKVEKS